MQKPMFTTQVSMMTNHRPKNPKKTAGGGAASRAGGGAVPEWKPMVEIMATKNAPDSSITVNGSPSIRKNEATTEILLSDGETAVIGGILIVDRGQTIAKVPFFGDLPLVGWLFRKKTMKDDKRELLIFITPRIVKQEAI